MCSMLTKSLSSTSCLLSKGKIYMALIGGFCRRCLCGVVVITSALHAEGPRFEPEQRHFFSFFVVLRNIQANQMERSEHLFGTGSSVFGNAAISQKDYISQTQGFAVCWPSQSSRLPTSHADR